MAYACYMDTWSINTAQEVWTFPYLVWIFNKQIYVYASKGKGVLSPNFQLPGSSHDKKLDPIGSKFL